MSWVPASAASFHSVPPSSASAGKNSSHCFGVISRGSPWKRRVGGSSQPQTGSWLQWQPVLPEGMRTYFDSGVCRGLRERKGVLPTLYSLSLKGSPGIPKLGFTCQLPLSSASVDWGCWRLPVSSCLELCILRPGSSQNLFPPWTG